MPRHCQSWFEYPKATRMKSTHTESIYRYAIHSHQLHVCTDPNLIILNHQTKNLCCFFSLFYLDDVSLNFIKMLFLNDSKTVDSLVSSKNHPKWISVCLRPVDDSLAWLTWTSLSSSLLRFALCSAFSDVINHEMGSRQRNILWII